MVVTMLLLAALAIAWVDLRALARNGRIQDLAISLVFMGAALTLGIFSLLRIHIPNPLMGIKRVFQPLSLLMDSLLQ
ncbi:hypothetical protein [Paenibacillus mucilaginosus]|uniref:Uncharacterized protein n=1 Tax=Paenibacillus mucilaginosus (strain KNP414) TaxID=1036673 RepID=F8FQ94_PAEMK|nr:hypothetical protein [Paenibacillus mucilaginosus]AEI40314.1 hypothetical protein KNP414_01752 [Paenibacillus mucilaginosus KNP414]MCG7213326.1 hypothetical protein [Paenibacillus mucilaginosus]WDM29521.1 hypothetical protein KCX80_10350 [Paenibacillus mucilaginosus]